MKLAVAPGSTIWTVAGEMLPPALADGVTAKAGRVVEVKLKLLVPMVSVVVVMALPVAALV